MDDDAAAYVGITRLLGAYADCVTRQAWDEMASLATDDARFVFDRRGSDVLEVGRDEVIAVGKQAGARFDFFEFVPLNHVVSVGDGGTAAGRAYAMEVGQERASGAWVTIYGLYHDDYVRRDGAWRFARRHYQTMARRVGGQLESFPATYR